MNLILFGFKGCGKSYFGRCVAQILSSPFLDLDNLISNLFEEQCGQHLSSREIYQMVGRDGFRELEHLALLSLQERQGCVIALGGGAILEARNLELLEKMGELVFLEISQETLKQRLFIDPLPAILDPRDPEGSFERLYQERYPLYQQIPAKHLLLDGKSDQQIINELVSIFTSNPRRLTHGQ